MRLHEMVYDTIKWNIDEQRLPAGLVLEEATIARLLEISRGPVASALKRLCEQRLIRAGDRRGFVVGLTATPFRRDLTAAGLEIPTSLAEQISNRRFRSRIYPSIEQAVAACLPSSRFLINESQLAQYYGVSRTIAHEALVRLERLGIVSQRSSHWYAGPLTMRDLRDHYEMRWLLEPVALADAAPSIEPTTIAQMRERARAFRAEHALLDFARLDLIERDLHLDLVLRCSNRQMTDTIRRSQLPLIATNASFQSRKRGQVPLRTIDEHLRVLDALAAHDIAAAAAALEDHLKSAFEVVAAILGQLGDTTWELPPYMTRDG